jgi:hypothetical protein
MHSSNFWLSIFGALALLATAVPTENPANISAETGFKEFKIVNNCHFEIYPAILSIQGSSHCPTGFHFDPFENYEFTTDSDWIGRIWARTDCELKDDGKLTCFTGDCNEKLECETAGERPATLAEFTFEGYNGETFYDISAVDGYNLDLEIHAKKNRNDEDGIVLRSKSHLSSDFPSSNSSVSNLLSL